MKGMAMLPPILFALALLLFPAAAPFAAKPAPSADARPAIFLPLFPASGATEAVLAAAI
jgi:hypothetical protein